MSTPALTAGAQLRYTLQWFGEFSELQREDFLPVLAAARAGRPPPAPAPRDDKPISLFQCRIKLFNEWYPTWAEEDGDRLVAAVAEMDPDFGTRLQDALAGQPAVNGDADGCEVHEDLPAEVANIVVQAPEENRESPQENMGLEIAAAS